MPSYLWSITYIHPHVLCIADLYSLRKRPVDSAWLNGLSFAIIFFRNLQDKYFSYPHRNPIWNPYRTIRRFNRLFQERQIVAHQCMILTTLSDRNQRRYGFSVTIRKCSFVCNFPCVPSRKTYFHKKYKRFFSPTIFNTIRLMSSPFTYANSFRRDIKVVQTRSEYRSTSFELLFVKNENKFQGIHAIVYVRTLICKNGLGLSTTVLAISLDPLGESDQVYREMYRRQYNDFMTKVKCFGDVYKRAKFKIPRIEPNAAPSEQVEHVVDNRTAEWNLYKVHTV